ncbi:MAG: hypothetical protein PHE73_09085 [Sulfurovaceae bacterium]|nr:hypothetical protein [Sulfurovaceae bacterium]
MVNYDIQIEIDADTGNIVWVKKGIPYYYTVEELEGKGKIDEALQGDADITVYSQGQTYTLEEYLEYTQQDDQV